MGALLADLLYSGRVLRKSPVFALVTIGTLALGIGATTAMFSVVDGVLLKRLPMHDQDRLLVVWTSIPERGVTDWPFSYTSYTGVRDRLHTVSGVAAHPYSGPLPAAVHLDDGSAMSMRRTAVTGDWFEVLGVRPRAGRLLTAADDHVGAPPVVVLSSGIAERLFGSIAGAIGRRVRIQETTHTVVGVTPAAFDYPGGADAWVPAVRFRDSPYMAWHLITRIAPGFTIDHTVADLKAALTTLPPETGPLGSVTSSHMVHAQRVADEVVGEVRPALLMLGAGVLLMLIVAGVNVANLVIARGLSRQRELSIRAAIGASRMRLLRQFATEALVLGAIAAGVAAAVAFITLKVLIALAPAELPRVAEIAVDGRALAFTAGVAMLWSLLFGVLPVFQAAHVAPADALRAPDATGAHGLRRYWLRHALVVGQVAITMLVLSVAGLLLRSFDRMQRLDVGFSPNELLLAEVDIPPSRYAEPVDIQRAMMRLAEHVATLPGISHATALSSAPFAGSQGVDATVFAEGQPFDESANPLVNYEGVDSRYFSTLGLPVLHGRAIDTSDRAGTQPVVVVNEAFARLFWPGKDPVGRRVKWGTSKSAYPWLTVVGVVADTRYRELTTLRLGLYVPYEHGLPVSPGYLAVRGSSPAVLAGAIRRAVASLEPGAVVVRIEQLPRLLAAPLARPRFHTTLAASFAALALLLSAAGTYGMLSFIVRQRRREIGIRMALGAAPSQVRRLVMNQGLTIGAVGVVLGVAAAIASGRFLEPLLFNVDASDPVVLAGTGIVLLLSILAATLLPIRSASRTDPLLVLRSD